MAYKKLLDKMKSLKNWHYNPSSDERDVVNFLNLIQPYCFRSMPVQWQRYEDIENKEKLAENYAKNLIHFINNK